VISHGTGGGAETHYDTALALAEAGFVAVAVTHTGDNWHDHAFSFTQRNFVERPRHIGHVIDFMLSSWEGRNHIDPARIGMFGHSAGGATVLIAVGGNPDFDLGAPFCRDHPDAWDCQRVKTRAGPAPAPSPEADRKPPEWHHDPRIKTAAIAAPAIGYMFTKDGLTAVTIPIQLWRAENDRVTPNQWNADVVKAALPKPPEDHLVPLAGHFDFLAPCSAALAERAPEICRDPPAFDRTAFHRDFNAAIVAFFRARMDSR